jgi:transcriptional regulator with XRE-family HTH domain
VNVLKSEFCKRLKKLRKERELTQNDISNFLGLASYTTISKWEKGVNDPPIELCVKLAEFFKVSLNYLVGESNQRQEDSELEKVSVTVFTQSDVTLIQRFHAMSSIGQKMVLDMMDSIEKMEKRN